MKPLWKKISLGMAAVIACGALWTYFFRDSYITSAVQTYGSAILGVPVKLKSSHLSVVDQSIELNGLFVGNPTGFKSKYLLQLDSVLVKLDVASLTGDVVHVHEIRILKPEITYEKIGGSTNLNVVQKNADSFARETMKSLPAMAGGKKSAEKRFIISEVVVKDGSAAVLSDSVLTPNLNVALPNLHLRDIGKRTNGATSADATKQVMQALTASVTNAVGNAIAGAANSVGHEIGKGAKSLGGALQNLFHR